MEIKEVPFTRLNLRTDEKYSPVPGDLAFLQNVEIDDNGSLVRRSGFRKYNAVAINDFDISGLYGYFRSDGIDLMVASCGNKLSEVALTGAHYDIETAADALSKFDFVTYLDTLYYCNGSNPNKRYVGPTGTPLEMGLPLPITPLIAAIGASGNVPVGFYYYKVSYVYGKYGESSVGIASAVIEVETSAKKIELSSIPTGGTDCTARRIYRTPTRTVEASNANEIEYYLIDQIDDNITTDYTDNLEEPDYDFPAPINNGLPPAIFTKFCVYQERIFALDGSSKVYWSDTGHPDIWPSSNYGYVGRDDGDIALGLFTLAGRLYVYKSRSMWVLLGQSLDTYRFEKVMDIGCSYPRTVCNFLLEGIEYIFFLSQKGGYLFNGGQAQLITRDIQSELEKVLEQGISSKYGSEGSAVYWDNKLYLFVKSASIRGYMEGWVFSPSRNVWIGGPHIGIDALQFIQWKGTGRKDVAYYGSRDGFVYLFDFGNNDNNNSITSKVSFKKIDFGYPERKLFYKLRVQATLPSNILDCILTTENTAITTMVPIVSQISEGMIWGQSKWGVPTRWGGPGLTMFSKAIPYHIAGDYLNIEFQCSDKIQAYKIHQILAEYEQVKAR